MKTEYALYIAANTRYHCSNGDAEEFEKALESLGKFDISPFYTFEEGYYQKDCMAGMYPELGEALDYYISETYGKNPEKREMSDVFMGVAAKRTIRKFKLKEDYDFDCEPNEEQLRRINERIKPKQRKNAEENAPGFLKDMAIAVINASTDYRDTVDFLRKIESISRVVSGEVSEEMAREYIGVRGVKEGLAFLEMKKQGIIDEKLNIIDIDRFCNSEAVKNVVAGKQTYDLSETMRRAQGKQLSPMDRIRSKLSKSKN